MQKAGPEVSLFVLLLFICRSTYLALSLLCYFDFYYGNGKSIQSLL